MEIDTSKIVEFSMGLPGFIEETKFVLLDLPGNPVFQVLQSVRSETVAFIVTNPYTFYTNYTVDLNDSLQETLHIESERDVAILAIVTLSQPFDKSTLNLKAPVIINSKNKRGKQYILNTDDYSSKASITPSLGVKGE
ncbi:flagellar assembly protein FliW [Virgibacillus oceani]|nr:flagellar assembly protein FliW [Virgibacillus oceani]